MNYKLINVVVNINQDQFGGRDRETEICISEDKEKLEAYCQKTYGQSAINPDKFSYDYYKIAETQTIIL